MIRSETDYLRIKLIYNYLTSKESFKYKLDLGGIYEMESDGVDLKFFNIVKARRTGKFYQDKEIILLNVTPYSYTNFDGKSKHQMIVNDDFLLNLVLLGMTNEEVANICKHSYFLKKKTVRKRDHLGNVLAFPLETDLGYTIRYNEVLATLKEVSQGLFEKYMFFYVGDDSQMIKPLNFIGYYYYLAKILCDINHRMWGRNIKAHMLETFFGSHCTCIEKKFQEYIDIAAILNVPVSIEESMSEFNSLQDIQKSVKNRIYIFYEVIKYFFKNKRQFKDIDHKNIDSRSYDIRKVYSALGGKFCIKAHEQNDPIAYFTALRVDAGFLPLLINTTNALAREVLCRRFDLAL